jgi:serine/threonine-protein kinase RsbT
MGPVTDGEPPKGRSSLSFPIENENDVLSAGTETWNFCRDAGFSNLASMHVRTAFSELGRNILKYAGRGEVIVKILPEGGVKLLFLDQGPGIPDIEQAMDFGFSTAGSLGLGLPGARKLADHFEIASQPGKGTQVTFVKYLKASPRKTEAIPRGYARAWRRGLPAKDGDKPTSA